ncbi:MAG: PhzF family phenazine biosynthesis isomerase, partial [Bacteroidota bacterium]
LEAIFLSQQKGQYHLRYFTNISEIPYSGHPSLAAACLLQQEIIKENIDSITLHYPAGQSVVDLVYDEHGALEKLWLNSDRQAKILIEHDRDQMAQLLGIARENVSRELPVIEIAAPIPFILIPLVNVDDLSRINIKTSDYKAYLISENCHFSNSPYKVSTPLYPFALVQKDPVPLFQSRMFTLLKDQLVEHTGTASASTAFLAYLLSNYQEEQVQATIHQAAEVGRNAIIYLEGKVQDGKVNMRIGGKVQIMAKGQLLV